MLGHQKKLTLEFSPLSSFSCSNRVCSEVRIPRTVRMGPVEWITPTPNNTTRDRCKQLRYTWVAPRECGHDLMSSFSSFVSRKRNCEFRPEQTVGHQRVMLGQDRSRRLGVSRQSPKERIKEWIGVTSH